MSEQTTIGLELLGAEDERLLDATRGATSDAPERLLEDAVRTTALDTATTAALPARVRVRDEEGRTLVHQLLRFADGSAELDVLLPAGARERQVLALEAAPSDSDDEGREGTAALGDAAPRSRDPRATRERDGDGTNRGLGDGGTAATNGRWAPSVEEIADHEGQASWCIETPGATWIYHRHGGGFASLLDREGRDWIAFRPFGGSDGIYRGIPNLAYPENVFHPGHETCRSTLLAAGPLAVTLESRSRDGAWHARWRLYRTHAELTVLAFGHPYWFLYEGTPAGRLDETRGFTLRSDGRRRSLGERWDEVLPAPKWIGFGHEGEPTLLWLASHDAANARCRDSYWPMEGNMTVFGFGRLGLESSMRGAPARFSVGLIETESGDRDRVAEAVGACVRARARSRARL